MAEKPENRHVFKSTCIICNYKADVTAFVAKESEDGDMDFACPQCGTTTSPMNDEEEVTVKMNWTELRILCRLAENQAILVERSKAEEPGYLYANKDGPIQAVYSIAKRVRAQHADKYDEDPHLAYDEELKHVFKLAKMVGARMGEKTVKVVSLGLSHLIDPTIPWDVQKDSLSDLAKITQGIRQEREAHERNERAAGDDIGDDTTVEDGTPGGDRPDWRKNRGHS